MEKLVDWLITIIDPREREQKRLEIKILENELDKRKIELKSQETRHSILDTDLVQRKTKLDFQEDEATIDLARSGVALVREALEMHDQIINRDFPEQVAKGAFYSAVAHLGNIRNFQERTNIISSVSLSEHEPKK